ncbi:hypothetical protein CHCC20335_0833 [Bacillus paralicheniformis]|nr:hypothetical protein CHCC20335_0833 [Bacillus paralicheniformis]
MESNLVSHFHEGIFERHACPGVGRHPARKWAGPLDFRGAGWFNMIG